MSFIDRINRFATNPVNLNHKRSKFNLSHKVATTFLCGKLIPLDVIEILPGDSMSLDFASVIRSNTPALPVMDQAYFDVFAFWCPSRILTVHDKDFQKIHGENVAGSWAPTSESTLINTGNTFKISASSSKVKEQSLADYLGIPINFYHQDMELSRLPFNGYWSIWNEFFRDQNTQVSIDWKSYTNANMCTFACGYSSNAGLCDVNKFHDYFTSALNSPQKGNSVLLPLGTTAPVITGADHQVGGFSTSVPSLRFASATSHSAGTTNLAINYGSSGYLGNVQWNSSSVSGTTDRVIPANLYADLSNATAASVNDLRQAFAIQKLLEKDARGGTRFREMLYSHYGVSIPDNTVQVPEYLGGKRIPLNMQQVLQTSENNTTPIGTTGAFSNTADSSHLTTKSFAEPGYLYILGCVRVNQSYSQGISKLFTRYRRYDQYYPVFANLGEQAIKTTELYATYGSTLDEVFGYQEAWAEYRYLPSRVTGYLSHAQSSDLVTPAWTYSNNFTAKPVLNSSFMKQDSSQFANTLVVPGGNYHFILDGWVNLTAWREMPYFSIPGLIDHH